MGNLSTYYTATSLSDIADTFQERADACSQESINARNMRLSAIYRAESNIWLEAVRILRTTTLICGEQSPPQSNRGGEK
jgi:hypothetical protein